MLILEPYAHETIWGGERLRAFCQSESNSIGHLYSVYDSKEQSNLILNEPYKGRTIHDYFSEHKKRFSLDHYSHFPIIVAIVEAKENLSIQVHPDDASAKLLQGANVRGKNESWYFLETPKEGTIFCDCLCSSLEELKKAVVNKSIDGVTGKLAVTEGDYVYVEGGTLHAMSKGSFVYEIEENAGATFRFYDFDRKDTLGNTRELHLPPAFLSIDLTKKTKVKQYGSQPIQERLYSTQRLSNISTYQNNSSNLQIITFIEKSSELLGISLDFGVSILLEPNEKINFESATVIVAEPR